MQNPDITKQEIETILNKGVELTDQNREGIINQMSWQIKSRLLKFLVKPSDDDIKFANQF